MSSLSPKAMGRGPPEGWWRGDTATGPSTAFHAVPLPMSFAHREDWSYSRFPVLNVWGGLPHSAVAVRGGPA